MNRSHWMALAATLVLAVGPARPLHAQPRVSGTLWAASDVIDALRAIPLRGIPPALLRDAQGVIIIPNVIKVAFGFGGRYGEGVALGRNPDASWTSPVFVSLSGGSIGWQLGVQSVDIVLVFKTRRGLERILEGKGKLTLGTDVAVAAGPIGRQAEAATDARLQAEVYSYSRSRGLFAGIALEGAVILDNAAANTAFRTRPLAEDLQAAERLKGQLVLLSGPPAVPAPFAPPPIPPPPPVAPPPMAPPAPVAPPPLAVPQPIAPPAPVAPPPLPIAPDPVRPPA